MLEKRRWPPTSIFYGPSSVGKFLTAQAVAQKLICQTQEGCGQCPPCQQVTARTSGSLLIIQPETTQIKAHQSREVVEFMQLKGLGVARTVIINEAHRLNSQGANILLKTLEEPPENSYLILITPSLSGILPTLRSRAQLIRFSSLPPEDLSQLIEAPQWALSTGQIHLAQELMELDKNSEQERAYSTWSTLLKGDVTGAFQQTKEQNKNIEDNRHTLWLWQQMLKASWFLKLGRNSHLWTGDVIQRLSQLNHQQLSGITLGAVQLEKDLLNNLDSSLCFENYFYKVNNFIQGRGGPLL